MGAVDTETKELRMDIMVNRNANYFKIFITNHIIIPGTNIIHDGWRAYSLLDSHDSVYIHEEYNHCQGNFGYGLVSTSHIESEFRYIIFKLNNAGKEKFFKRILKICYKLNEYDLMEEDELIDFNNNDY